MTVLLAFWHQLQQARGSYLPHAVCLDYGPLLWLHAVSDGVIALSYFSIPVALFVLVWKRQDMGFRGVVVMFGLFILLCGATHALHVWTLFVPDYTFTGVVKALTAVVSLATALLLWPLLSKMLVVSSPGQLALINQDLRNRLLDQDLVKTTLEQRVAERTRQLEDTARAKSRLLAGVGHDLRQPVQAMFYFTQALANRIDDPVCKGILDDLDRSMLALKSLLDSLLDMSRLDAGAVQPQIEVFAINPLLERVAAEFAPMAGEKGLRLTVVPSSLRVRGDPALLARILQNLAANAVRYTVSGGIVIGCRRRGDQLACQVWDSGIGIPADQQARIFEEFAQVGDGGGERGFGLGLAIVRRLCRLLGHDLGLRSVPGRGSMFSVAVPLAD